MNPSQQICGITLSPETKVTPAAYCLITNGTVNSQFLGETPLIGACRSGQSNIVRILLNEGADATRLDHLGRGALHFLSSFDTQGMAEMAHLLLGSGGELETWSTGSSDFSCSKGRPGFDSKYGHGNGAALLWAVQTNCSEAVKVLLDLGAKVFPIARPVLKTVNHLAEGDGRLFVCCHDWKGDAWASWLGESRLSLPRPSSPRRRCRHC